MSLRKKQSKFAVMAAQLILKAEELGFEVTLGDAYRDPRAFGGFGKAMHTADGKRVYGRTKSLHKRRLAIDLNLFKNGKYLTTTEDHRPLGEWWEAQGGSWGGRFNDANHYSLEHNGMR